MGPPTPTISADELTSILHKRGSLREGRVCDVSQTPNRIGDGFTSTFVDLNIRYSEESTGMRPAKCLMKYAKRHWFDVAATEVRFYELVAHRPPVPFLLRTYGTLIEETEKIALILMEDRGDQFLKTRGAVPPPMEVCERAARTLAPIHAMWWGSDLSNPASKLTRTQPDVFRNQLISYAEPMFDRLGDALSDARRSIILRIIDRYPELAAQCIKGSGRQTVVHGDAYFRNFLIPEDPAAPALLIDWQAWDTNLGAGDLAYMVALNWFPERRLRFERRMLSAYLEAIQQEGIQYAHEELWTDYRIMVIDLFAVVLWFTTFAPEWIWWSHLERAFLAFEDLDCDEFLR